ncbi:MAG: pyridoxine 5'-phosphate synthase [Usitatibacteraceae bacterium]
MAKLSVNLNKIALLRNTRTLGIPSVTHAARIAIGAGADGITVHPRPDRRHILDQDVRDLSSLLESASGIEFNIEGNPFHQVLGLVREFRPRQCTLVPDETGQATSDHGWDLAKDGARLAPVVAELKSLGVRVSLFMDPLPEAIRQAAALGADRVELYTEPYAQAYGTPNESSVLRTYVESAEVARSVGLGVNAGHDLNLVNLPTFVRAMASLDEVSIGHALIADAISKAYGTGIGESVGWHDMQVTHDQLGKPSIETSAPLRERMRSRDITRAHLSITDEADHALAFVILEKS